MTFNRKAYMKAYMKAYSQRPEVKAYRKAYRRRPEVKAREKAYRKAYYQRPEVKARLKAYMKARRMERNLALILEKSKNAPPDSLFSADREVLEALALDGEKLDRLCKKRAGL